MRKKNEILIVASIVLGLLVSAILAAQAQNKTRPPLPRGSMVSHELTGDHYYLSTAESYASQFLNKLLPGDDTMNLEDMEGLGALVAAGVRANSNQFVRFIEDTFRHTWSEATVTLESRYVPSSNPESILGDGRYHHELVITGVTHVPARFPY